MSQGRLIGRPFACGAQTQRCQCAQLAWKIRGSECQYSAPQAHFGPTTKHESG